MNTNKLLNSLIDEIFIIELRTTDLGVLCGRDNLREYNAVDKDLARHKTKAFAIINKLIKNETN